MPRRLTWATAAATVAAQVAREGNAIRITATLDALQLQATVARDGDKLDVFHAGHHATLALLDDLNTPSAVSELSAPLKAANDLLTTKAGKKADGSCGAAKGKMADGSCGASKPAMAASK